MKKSSIIYKLCLCFSVILFTGCFDPIYYNIKADVSPEEATVSGNINSIVRFDVSGQELLVLAANGGIRYKPADKGNERSKINISTASGKNTKLKTSWKAFDNEQLPFKLHKFNYYIEGGEYDHQGQSIVKVVADSKALYIVTVEYKKDDTEGTTIPCAFRLYANENLSYVDDELVSTKDDWKLMVEEIYQDKDTSFDYFTFYYYKKSTTWRTDFNVFCTNSVKNEHREAFIRNGYIEGKEEQSTLYKLNGTSDIEKLDIDSVNIVDKKETQSDIDAAAYFGDQLYFFDTAAVTTNETKTSNATILYYGGTDSKARGYGDHTHLETKKLYAFNGAESEDVFGKDNNAGYQISCLTYTADALLIGRALNSSNSTSYGGGIVKIQLNSDGTPVKNNDKAELSAFQTNADIQLSNSYSIYTLLAVDPEKTELENIIYSSIGFRSSGTSTAVTYNNIGLWSYYPDRRNWNRE